MIHLPGTRGALTLLPMLALALGACDDDSGGTALLPDTSVVVDAGPDRGAGGEGGMGGVGGMGGAGGVGGAGGGGGMTPDAAAPDADVVVDAAVDAVVDAVVDAAPVDAGPAPLIDAGVACVEAAECGRFERCVGDVCRPDLRPKVYRMVTAEVMEPQAAAGELQVALMAAVVTGNLNLMFEAGGYSGEDYRFNVGNGRPLAGVYEFRHNLPIQNFDGRWRHEDDRAEWHIEGNQPFRLVVPAGTTNDDPPQTCWTEFSTDVNMQLWPVEVGDAERLHGFVDGYVLRSNLEDVEIRFNGNVIRFIEFFEGVPPTIDANGDGVNDAYPFILSMEAELVQFEDADDARNPNPPPLLQCD